MTIAAGATLETDGRDLQVGGLNGAGQVKDSVGTTTALYVGADNVTASFAGTTDPQFDVIKVGGGTQRLTHPDGSLPTPRSVRARWKLFGETAITGVVETVGGTLGVTFGTQGLDGKYYSLSAVPRTTDFVSYTAVTNFLSGKTPNVIQNSTGFGATFNALSNGSRFPAPYNAQAPATSPCCGRTLRGADERELRLRHRQRRRQRGLHQRADGCRQQRHAGVRGATATS